MLVVEDVLRTAAVIFDVFFDTHCGSFASEKVCVEVGLRSVRIGSVVSLRICRGD